MKLIELTCRKNGKQLQPSGVFVRVDDADYSELNKWNWSFKIEEGLVYAIRKDSITGKQLRMHRVILGITNPSIQVDHRDRNTLNNQRSNLRPATPSQNNHNKKGWGKSKYKGVSWFSQASKWSARITPPNEKKKHLGYFNNEIDAAKTYDRFAKMYFGEFANLNFK